MTSFVLRGTEFEDELQYFIIILEKIRKTV